MIEIQEIGLKKFCTELWRVVILHQILAGNDITCLDHYQIVNAVLSSGVWLHLKVIFFLGLGLSVKDDKALKLFVALLSML